MALDFIAGCLGGCAGVAVGHPFDTVKVRLQTQDFLNPKYRGTLHCFADTIQRESVRGLYKGMSSPMAGVAVINAIVFGVQGNMARKMKDPDSLRSQTLSGATAGFFQSFISSPMELVKTRVQIQTEAGAKDIATMSTAATSSSTKCAARSYMSPMDCIRKIITTEGYKGIFRGQFITILRDVPAMSTYFFTYEYLSRAWSSNGCVSAPVVLAAGGMAGIASWVFTYPIDVVKSRIQADGVGGLNKYSGIINCVKQSIKAEGIGSMTRGLASTIIRAFPVNATTFAVVSYTQSLFNEEDEYDKHSDTWYDVLCVGENLIEAAKAPIPAFANLNKKHNLSFEYCISLLPEQVQNSPQHAKESLENWQSMYRHGYISSSIKKMIPEVISNSRLSQCIISECKAQQHTWIGDQLIQSCAHSPSISALTNQHHYNLVNSI